MGQVSIVSGEVLGKRARDERSYPVRVGASLVVGETVTTNDDGVVQMLLGEGTLVTLGTGGSVDVLEGSESDSAGGTAATALPAATLELGHGLLRAFVSRFSAEQLEIRLGQAPISVRIAAAEGGVESLADGVVRIFCLGGGGAVRWRAGSSDPWQTVAPGHEIALGPSSMEGIPELRAMSEERQADLLSRTQGIPTLRRRRPTARRPEDFGPPPARP